jgi:hypothetical protein
MLKVHLGYGREGMDEVGYGKDITMNQCGKEQNSYLD